MTRFGATLAGDPAQPLGLILSGGGARGTFQVGVWKVLLEEAGVFDRAPPVISGTSAGALNGALIAAGLTPDEILEFWLDLARHPPVKSSELFFADLRRALRNLALSEAFRSPRKRTRELSILGKLLGKHRWYRRGGLAAMVIEFLLTARFDNVSQLLAGLHVPHLFDTSPLRARLREAIGSETLRSDVRLAINTVDVATGQVLRIVNHPPSKRPGASSAHYHYVPELTMDMIVASASIPLLFNPVSVFGTQLWDGGLLVNSPMAPAVALGAERLIPVLVTVEASLAGPLLTFGSAVERLVDTFLENAYNIDRKLLLARNELVDRLPDEDLRYVTLFRPIRPESAALFDAGSYLYFERDMLLSMYQAGQRAARRWLASGPLLDSRHYEG